MGDILQLARPELRELKPYSPGGYESGLVRLNANESPWRIPSDNTERGLNFYPPPRPLPLRRLLAEHYGVIEEKILVTRGSTEAIDLLIRGFCAAGKDQLLTCPPTFDMYRLYAGIQNAEVLEVPLLREKGFAIDPESIVDRVTERTKIIFLCSPNNPTGQSIEHGDIEFICQTVQEKTLVVLDEAYQEFSDKQDFSALEEKYENVLRLRTLSKFISLAGVRCGAVIAEPRLIDFLSSILPPYSFPTPSIELVLKAFDKRSLNIGNERVQMLRTERAWLKKELMNVSDVKKVWPSDANFIFVETSNAKNFQETARQANVLVRTFPDQPALKNFVRITVGRREDNNKLLQAF